MDVWHLAVAAVAVLGKCTGPPPRAPRGLASGLAVRLL